MKRRAFLTLSAATMAATACRTAPATPPADSSQISLPPENQLYDGGVKMIEIPGGYHVWTKKVGPDDAPVKVLLLHGGPGASHAYFECFEDFLPRNAVQFFYYDQLDSGYSDRSGDPKRWTIQRFRDEVEAVRKGLGLDQFYLLGHSWGGILAIEYALAYQEHLKSLIISNMAASIPSYAKHIAQLRSELPPNVRTILDKYEKTGNYDAPEYQKTMMDEVYSRYICRVQPFPEPVTRALTGINEKLYNYFQGPNEFSVTGALKNWDRWSDLPHIHTRTLTIGARYDEMDPEDMKKMATLMPNATSWISDKGSHMTMWDDQFPYFRALLGFLKG